MRIAIHCVMLQIVQMAECVCVIAIHCDCAVCLMILQSVKLNCAVGRMCVCVRVYDCHPLRLRRRFNDIAVDETDTNFRIPFTKTKTFGQRAFSFTGPTQWNSLPYNVRHSVSTSSFKHALKTHLFKSAYN